MAVSVKDFLDAIRGRFNDEPNKVEVTGSNIKILKKHENESTNWASNVLRLGENATASTTSIIPVDKSQYSDFLVRIENNLDSSLNIDMFATLSLETGINNNIRYSLGNFSLAAGASKNYTFDDFDDKNQVFLGCYLFITSSSGAEGDINVYFGGAN